MSELTTRQWRLHDLLVERNEADPDVWTNNFDIIAMVDGYDFKDYQTNHNQTAFNQIRRDIQAIRDSEVVQKIIISSPLGYRIAKRDEIMEYLKKEKIQILSRLKRCYHQEEKALKDGQGVIVEDGSRRREFIEAFLDN